MGRHLWSRGYFGESVGAVNETQIKQYIEDQSDDACWLVQNMG